MALLDCRQFLSLIILSPSLSSFHPSFSALDVVPPPPSSCLSPPPSLCPSLPRHVFLPPRHIVSSSLLVVFPPSSHHAISSFLLVVVSGPVLSLGSPLVHRGGGWSLSFTAGFAMQRPAGLLFRIGGSLCQCRVVLVILHYAGV